ncbi:TetR family transcriptional regulator [Allostreptomyces psammosilenae]|uniref:AcrR family transcriptional regulator n=1 Tax=Allostreptomyces psammosilenae TaxID=1892865 RepID=A0A852ZPP4_9ACTN|nr:AcrR family transcriptional regulator [Allostreptomyces psammosilenae]
MTDPVALPNTLAERKRQLVRDELTTAALTLFISQGYEETTVDQIVAAAGVSRRTFFRYFRSKDDVVVEFLGDLGARLREELADRPAHEPPALALRRTLALFAGAYGPAPRQALELGTLVITTPALLARYLERQSQWRADLTVELARRMGAGTDDLRPGLLTAVAFAAFETAVNAWVARRGERTLAELVEEAFDLLDAPPAPARRPDEAA